MNLAVAIGKLLRSSIRLFRRGGGSALPGLVAGKIDPKLIDRSLNFKGGVVVVTGSAGKSSTTKMLTEILQAHGLAVFTNPSTANIEQGLVSAILHQSDLNGRLPFDIAVLEVDEGHGSALAQRLKPRVAVFTNLMVDQLDRFVDPALVLEKLAQIAGASQELVVNADDANLDSLGEAVSFGSKGLTDRQDYPEYAPTFASKSRVPELVLEEVFDQAARFRMGAESYEVRLPAPGVHVALNAVCAVLAASRVLGADFDLDRARTAVSASKPVFARDERLEVNGVPVRLMLVQNPGSFRLNLALLSSPERLMIAIGSDVHDPAWLWSVDFSSLSRVNLVSGANASELALRLAYQGVPVDYVDSAVEAVDSFLRDSSGLEATIMVSADSMRRIRRHLRLAK
jgi:UDP-N-acetylmuramyl tripeptide synthase